jgi:hypothetical protein
MTPVLFDLLANASLLSPANALRIQIDGPLLQSFGGFHQTKYKVPKFVLQ